CIRARPRSCRTVALYFVIPSAARDLRFARSGWMLGEPQILRRPEGLLRMTRNNGCGGTAEPCPVTRRAVIAVGERSTRFNPCSRISLPVVISAVHNDAGCARRQYTPWRGP